MAYEFTKLADVPALETVPEGANAFIEVSGEIKRVPGDGLGGGGGIPTAIIRLDVDTGDGASIAALADLTGGTATVSAADGSRATTTTIYTGVCDNMTFAEAKAALLDGGALDARVVIALTDELGEGSVIVECVPAFTLGYASANGVELVGVSIVASEILQGNTALYWLPDGTITSDQNAVSPS